MYCHIGNIIYIIEYSDAMTLQLIRIGVCCVHRQYNVFQRKYVKRRTIHMELRKKLLLIYNQC